MPLRKNWDIIKLQVMEDLLRIKFSDPSFKKLLLATENEVLQEGNWWKDYFWGVDKTTGYGQNHLGKLLMKIRNEYNP